MDPFLAAFYGTGATDEELEKTAQLQMLEKIAEEEGIDPSQLSEEDVASILAEANAEEGGEEEPTEEEVVEAQEKLAEADYIGRIVAHSFWNEMGNIQKEASWAGRTIARHLGTKTMGRELGGRAVKAVKEAPKRAYHATRAAAGKAYERTGAGAESLGRRVAGKKRGAGLSSRQARALGVATVGVPTAAAVGGGMYAREKMKKSSDIVEQRALEFLADAGLVDNMGNVVAPDVLQKTAENVDRAALQYLEELGYPVTWYR